MRQVCGTRACDGARPERTYLRAVRSLIPAFAAAVTCGIPLLIKDISSLTCSSVTTTAPLVEAEYTKPSMKLENRKL